MTLQLRPDIHLAETENLRLPTTTVRGETRNFRGIDTSVIQSAGLVTLGVALGVHPDRHRGEIL